MSNPYIEWIDKPGWFVKITDLCMNQLDIKLETGQHPRVVGDLSIKTFLESLKDNDLKNMIMLCEARLRCLEK